MVQELIIGFSNLAISILSISILIYLWKFTKLPLVVKILGIYLFLNLATELYGTFLYNSGSNNLFILHVYTFLEFLSWSIFYKYLFISNKRIQKYFGGFITLISILLILNSIFLEPFSVFNSNAKTLVQVILISYAVTYFFNVFGKIDFSVKENQSISLINFAVILYYSGSLFIFMFSKMLVSFEFSLEGQRGFWLFNALLNVVFQLLILISLWKIAFNKTKSLS